MSHPLHSAIGLRFRPILAGGALLATDLVALGLAAAGALVLRAWLPGGSELLVSAHLALWPGLLVFPAVFLVLGLYRVALVNPAEELRRLVGASTLVWLLATAMPFITRAPQEVYSRGFLLLAWGLSLFALPLLRSGLRRACGPRSWWGYPVVVLGAGATAMWVLKVLQRQPGLGLKPVMVLDDDPTKHGTLLGIPVQGPLDRAPEIAERHGIRHAILAMPGAPVERLKALEAKCQDCFPSLLVVPNLCGLASLWVEPRDLGGILGLEVRRNLLLKGPRSLKRLFDLTLCILFSLPVLVLVAVIVLVIRVDSTGSAFYSQERLGRDGRRIRVWKFRSMVRDADQVLAEHLARDPALRDEWQRDRKLRKDPRITRAGRLLRITSLDELPQLWNVLNGTMSLVGPRPIVSDEVPLYGPAYDLYQRVRPGLTGLWQVSGRNDTGYAERILLDGTYVRNWSVWLDLVILAKTAWVVVCLRGAY